MLTTLAALVLAIGSPDEPGAMPSSLRAPRGLTAGGYDHFMGQLAPSGKEIVFAGNANSTIEVFVQNLERGAPRPLFDEQADINQPRMSPDGTRLLYISYRENAGGSACVFDRKSGKRRCLTGPGTAVLHVFWFPDGRDVGVLTRRSLTADHQLRRIPAHGRGGEGRLLLEQNMSAPTVSPDGRWLAYVPLERPTADRGSPRGSLMRASPGLMLHRLDRATAPVHFVPKLPGTSSFPAFAADGSHLYFTQYLNDSNFDGVIDAKDNGVLFRAPFHGERDEPVPRGVYEQLTSGRMNCQYPAPASDRLLATCVRAGYLQIYALPLDGLVPRAWTTSRMEAEIAVSRDPWEQLLLLRRMLAVEEDPLRRTRLHQRMLVHHLAADEYESADDHLDVLARMADETDLPAAMRRALRARIAVQRELVAHRRAEHRLGHAKLSRAFVDAEHERIARLDAMVDASDDGTRRLIRIAQSEIERVLGEKALALELFDAIDIGAETDAAVLQAWARQAEALFRDLGDRERWLAVHEVLAEHPALGEREQLHHARAFVGVLGRGRAPADIRPLVDDARTRASGGSALSLMLELEATLLRVPTIGEEAAREELERLWKAAPSFEQHRGIAMAIIERAARNEWGHLLHVFGEQWLADVPVDHPERSHAEALYAEVMLERAYVELRHGRRPEARELFARVTRRTRSLEAYVGAIETALLDDADPATLHGELLEGVSASEPTAAFVEAYILARRLPQVTDDKRHAAQIERARDLLRPVAEALPRSPEVHHLYAYLAHRHFHRTGDKEAGMAAHARYHLALDLAPDDPRRRASILAELGLLQAALGNHRIALRHFAQRERLPFLDPQGELSFRLAKARSLFHTSAYPEAKAEMAAARALVEREPSLRRYTPLVLDRAALYHHAAGDHEGATALYGDLVATTSGESLAARMKARMGLGAAALASGQLELARASLHEANAMLDEGERFRGKKKRIQAESHFGRDDYRPLVTGLLATTYRRAGDLPAATAMLEERRELYRAKRKRRDTDLHELARIAHQLAELAYRRGDLEAARRHLEEGIAHADAWASRTETEIDEVMLALVRAAAELHLYGRVPASAFAFDPVARLHEAYRIITERPNPRWADERFLFAVYLTMLDTHRAR